jgi:hypothetical protein
MEMSALCKSVATASGYATVFALTATVATIAVAEPPAIESTAPPAVRAPATTTVAKPIDPKCKLFPHLCVPPLKVATPPAVQERTTPKSNVDSGFIRRQRGPLAADAKPSEGVAVDADGEIQRGAKPDAAEEPDVKVQPDSGN